MKKLNLLRCVNFQVYPVTRITIVQMLIATDVAARGLDVKDVELVVNYDMPAGTNAVEPACRLGSKG